MLSNPTCINNSNGDAVTMHQTSTGLKRSQNCNIIWNTLYILPTCVARISTRLGSIDLKKEKRIFNLWCHKIASTEHFIEPIERTWQLSLKEYNCNYLQGLDAWERETTLKLIMVLLPVGLTLFAIMERICHEN